MRTYWLSICLLCLLGSASISNGQNAHRTATISSHAQKKSKQLQKHKIQLRSYVVRKHDSLSGILYSFGIGTPKSPFKLYGKNGWIAQNQRRNARIRNWDKVTVGASITLAIPYVDEKRVSSLSKNKPTRAIRVTDTRRRTLADAKPLSISQENASKQKTAQSKAESPKEPSCPKLNLWGSSLMVGAGKADIDFNASNENVEYHDKESIPEGSVKVSYRRACSSIDSGVEGSLKGLYRNILPPNKHVKVPAEWVGTGELGKFFLLSSKSDCQGTCFGITPSIVMDMERFYVVSLNNDYAAYDSSWFEAVGSSPFSLYRFTVAQTGLSLGFTMLHDKSRIVVGTVKATVPYSVSFSSDSDTTWNPPKKGYSTTVGLDLFLFQYLILRSEWSMLKLSGDAEIKRNVLSESIGISF